MPDAIKLVDRYYAAFNNRDWGAYEQLFTANSESWAVGGPSLRGAQSIRDWDKSWTEAFPDARITSVRKSAEGGEIVASENKFSGTHTAALRLPDGEVPATGKRVEVPYVGIFQVEGDRLKNQRIFYDRLELQTQLGLAPAKARSA